MCVCVCVCMRARVYACVCVCVRASVLLARACVCARECAKASPSGSWRTKVAVATRQPSCDVGRCHACENPSARVRTAARTQRGRSADAAHCLLVKQRRPARFPVPAAQALIRSALSERPAAQPKAHALTFRRSARRIGLRGSRSVRWRVEGAGLQHLHEDERVRPRGPRLGRRERSATAAHTRRIGSAAR
jgi:hypothetical protein